MAAASTLNRGPGWFAARWRRLNGPDRIAGADLARGLAVFGMIAAHLLTIDPGSPLQVVNGRSSILFATLAGVSIGLVTGGVSPLTGTAMRTARQRLAVRGAVLWAIGIALTLTGVPVNVILPAYAFLFLLAIPLTGLRASILFALAALLALGMPWVQYSLNAWPGWAQWWGMLISLVVGWEYPFPLWIAFIAAGLGVARVGITRLRVQLWLLGVGTGLAVLGYSLDALSPSPEGFAAADFMFAVVWTADPHSSGVLEAVGSGGFALAALAACLLLTRVTVFRLLTLPLRAVGSMPLTAYVAQLLVWALVAQALLGNTADLYGIRELGLFAPLTIGILCACTAWALTLGRGPMEGLLDRAARLVVRSGGSHRRGR